MFLRDAEPAVCEWLFLLGELLQIGSNGFRRTLEKSPQFRLYVNLPLRAEFLFVRPGRSTVEALLRRRTDFGLALAGICRKSSARKGSISLISSVPLLRKTSISVRSLDRRKQQVTVQLLDK